MSVRNSIRSWHWPQLRDLRNEIESQNADLIFIQWVPFMYGSAGVNLSLPLAALGLSRRGHHISTVVHEPWVPYGHWSSWLIGPLQRLSLGVLVAGSDHVFVTTHVGAKMLQRMFSWRRAQIEWLPVGASIPVVPMTKTRNDLLGALSIPDSAMIMLTLHPFGAAKGEELLSASWCQLRKRYEHLHLVAIGNTSDEAKRRAPEISRDPRVHFTGYLPPDAISAWLQSADIFLAPFEDGITTRRTSVISAIAHHVPVVSTYGHLTEKEVFDNAPLVLTRFDRQEYATAVERLVDSPTERARMRHSSSSFYFRYFDWDVLAEKLLSGSAALGPRKARREKLYSFRP